MRDTSAAHNSMLHRCQPSNSARQPSHSAPLVLQSPPAVSMEVWLSAGGGVRDGSQTVPSVMALCRQRHAPEEDTPTPCQHPSGRPGRQHWRRQHHPAAGHEVPHQPPLESRRPLHFTRGMARVGEILCATAMGFLVSEPLVSSGDKGLVLGCRLQKYLFPERDRAFIQNGLI